MDIEILGENLKVNEALDDFARKKLEKLDRYLPNIVDIRVELRRENTRRGEDFSVAQITVRHKRGAILRSQEKYAGDMETALQLAINKMYRQIQRFKGKRDPKQRGRFAATQEELVIAEAIPDVEADGINIEESIEALIVRRKDVSITAMTEEEAVEQMELLGHSFFLFFNPMTGGINLVYRRRAGGYGVLNPTVG